MKLLTVIVILSAAGDAGAADAPAAVTLSGQRVRVTPEDHALSVEVTVHNSLDVALSSVDVGWLLAPGPKDLEAIRDPGALYLDAEDPKHAAPPAPVTVLRRAVAVTVPAHGTAVASFEAQGDEHAAAVTVYRTHVLGYTLADATLPLELRLLHGSAAADEKAAVDYFGLTSDAVTRLAARRRLAAVSAWVDALAAKVVAPVPARPSTTEAHERVFVVRALGVVGGQRAETALAQLRDREDLGALDEQVRVVLIDRLRGTRLETPLAFAVPATARSMRDVVDAALADARDLSGQVEKTKAEQTLAATAAAPKPPRPTLATSTTAETVPTPAINDAAPPSEPQTVFAPASTDPTAVAPPEKSFARTAIPWIAAFFGFIFMYRLIRGRRR